MSLFAQGVISEKSQAELMELVAFLHAVVLPEANELAAQWSLPRACNNSDVNRLWAMAEQLESSMALCRFQASRVADACKQAALTARAKQ